MTQRVRDELINVLILGGGGREHALYHHIKKTSGACRKVFVAPGNAGIPNEHILKCDSSRYLDIALHARREQVRLIIPANEAYLVDGYVNKLTYNGLKVFGPTASAAQLEASKSFAKNVFERAGVPTAEYGVATSCSEAGGIINRLWPCVIKADGLCRGKGVVVPDTIEEAKDAAGRMLEEKIHLDAGSTIVVERRLYGQEWSAMFICDGNNAIPLEPARDYKRAYDGDKGPNTGGMGAYCPADISAEKREGAKHAAHLILREMKRRGCRFHGVLYIGFIETEHGSMVLETNVRFGDPEIQVILARLKSDLVPYLLASIPFDGLRDLPPLEFSDEVAVCFVVAAEGYPGKCRIGFPVTDVGEDRSDSYLLHASTEFTEDGQLVTTGGRVVNGIGVGTTFSEAGARAYERSGLVHFQGCWRRTDIAPDSAHR